MSRAGDVITLEGSLDGPTGTTLVALVTEAVALGSARLEIDLCAVESFDAEGATALLTCRNITNEVAGGLHYKTCPGGAGQLALLQAYADPHASGGSGASSEVWEPAS